MSPAAWPVFVAVKARSARNPRHSSSLRRHRCRRRRPAGRPRRCRSAGRCHRRHKASHCRRSRRCRRCHCRRGSGSPVVAARTSEKPVRRDPRCRHKYPPQHPRYCWPVQAALPAGPWPPSSRRHVARTIAANKAVGPNTADQRVIARPALQRIRPTAAFEVIRASHAGNVVRGGVAQQGVIEGRSHDILDAVVGVTAASPPTPIPVARLTVTPEAEPA